MSTNDDIPTTREHDLGIEILYSSHPAMFRSAPFRFMLMVVLLLSSVITPWVWLPFTGLSIGIVSLVIVGFVIWWIETISAKLIVTNNSVKVYHGIFSKDVIQIYIQDITKYSSHQTLFQRIMKTADVEISSSASDTTEIDIKGLPQPSRIFSAINSRR